MQYRGFRRKSDGAWLTVLITTTKPRFGIPPQDHAEDVALAFNLTGADLDVIDASSDPRVAPLVFPQVIDISLVLSQAETLRGDVQVVLLANGVPAPPVLLDKIRDRLHNRLRGLL